MKKILAFTIVGGICSLIGFLSAKFIFVPKNIPFLATQKKIERTLDKYSIENLSNTEIKPGKLTVNKEKNTFSMDFDPGLNGAIASTSGQIRIPGEGSYPLVVMIRGYVDKEIFRTGIGTEPSSKMFAGNGYITVAPDFLGYGSSSPESFDLFEARMQTYTTVLSLLKSVDQIGEWDHKNLYIWAHSNGGQIALTTLEITGQAYPTTLWAPVSAPFPYSILYYEDELSDYGKYLRGELSKFESLYDVDKYSITTYLDRIHAPIQLHQGTSDESVPVKWNENLYNNLKDLNVDINYYTYPGANHNMIPSWDNVIQRDLEFFAKNLKKS